MKYSANPVLVDFSDATVPAEWKSKQAKRIYDAAREAELSGAHWSHVVSGSIKLEVQPDIRGPWSAYGTPDVVSVQKARYHAAYLRKQADGIEATLAAYGDGAFTVNREVVRAPKHPFDAERFITDLISRQDVKALWVHGIQFIRDASRSFVRAK